MSTVFNFFFVLICVQLLQHEVSPTDHALFFLFTLGGMMLINWIGSVWFKTSVFRWILPLLSIALLGWFAENHFHYGDYPLDFSNIRLLSLLLIGWGITIIAQGIQHLLSPFFYPNDSNFISHTAIVILLGFSIIFATFFASWYGILLLGVGYFLYNCFSRTKNDHILHSLILIASIGAITSHHAIESIDVTIGKMLAGLVIGSGVYLLGSLAFKSTHLIAKTTLITLSILLVVSLSLLHFIHPAYGGMETFVAACIAIAIVHLVWKDNRIGRVLFPILLAIGLIAPKNVQQEQAVEQITTSKQQSRPISSTREQIGKNADHLMGQYRIDTKSAILSFQLGPKGGVVKGNINQFEGTIDFGMDIKTAKFNVKLPTNHLTTHNSMRDKTVLGEKYLKAQEFPNMTFVANRMQQQNDGYLVSGVFTLLGESHSQDVFMKYTGEINGEQYFVGHGLVEHGKFGVPSSPQEGQEVAFTFEMKLVAIKG